MKDVKLLGDAVVLVRQARERIETVGQWACPECEGSGEGPGQHDTDCPLAQWLDDARRFLDATEELGRPMYSWLQVAVEGLREIEAAQEQTLRGLAETLRGIAETLRRYPQ